jgi:hypothetical protein
MVDDTRMVQSITVPPVPKRRWGGRALPKLEISKKATLNKPNIIETMNQNLTHRVIPRVFLFPTIFSWITRREWIRKTEMNMRGPGRFHPMMNHPCSRGFIPGSTKKMKESKKLVTKITMEICPTAFKRANFLVSSKLSPRGFNKGNDKSRTAI